MTRLAVFATHPIQYMAPLWRSLAGNPAIELCVYFFSDVSIRGGRDPDFGVDIAWDVPLVTGYEHYFLERDADLNGYRKARVRSPRRFLSSRRIDAVLVHGYTHPFERQVVMAAKRLGMRVLLRGEVTSAPRPGRGVVRRLLRSEYLRWFYRHIDAFCYLGQDGRAHLLEYGVRRRRLHYSPYSIDDVGFEASLRVWSRTKARDWLGLSDDAVVVLFSGKLIARKCPLLLVQALEMCARRREMHLIVLGDGTLSGEVRERGEKALGMRLTAPGFVNQTALAPYFAASDVFVLPSEFETWGLVVNEAMQASLPVVVSDAVGCWRDLVIPGETGLVFRSGDAEDLAGKLDDLAGDQVLRRSLGRNARSRVRAFSTEASVDGILGALRATGALE